MSVAYINIEYLFWVLCNSPLTIQLIWHWYNLIHISDSFVKLGWTDVVLICCEMLQQWICWLFFRPSGRECLGKERNISFYRGSKRAKSCQMSNSQEMKWLSAFFSSCLATMWLCEDCEHSCMETMIITTVHMSLTLLSFINKSNDQKMPKCKSVTKDLC